MLPTTAVTATTLVPIRISHAPTSTTNTTRPRTYCAGVVAKNPPVTRVQIFPSRSAGTP